MRIGRQPEIVAPFRPRQFNVIVTLCIGNRGGFLLALKANGDERIGYLIGFEAVIGVDEVAPEALFVASSPGDLFARTRPDTNAWLDVANPR